MRLFITFYFFLHLFLVFSQDKLIGLKAGLVDVDLVGDLGYNLEGFYEGELTKGLYYGFNFGVAIQNNFPSEFEPGNDFINVVPPAINEIILSLPADEGFLFGYQRYSVDYLQSYLRYRPPFSFLGHFFFAQIGLMIMNGESTVFTLDDWQSVNNQIISYTPRYALSNFTRTGWILGLGIERNIGSDYVLSLDAKYNLQFTYGRLENPLGLLRLGLARKL